MPNHVENTLEIHVWNRDRVNRIEEVKELLAGEDEDGHKRVIDFEKIIPPPEDMFRGNLSMEDRKNNPVNWYDWQTQYWGTKWNAYDAYIEDESYDTLIVKFTTAWAPPTPVIERLREILEEKYGEEGDVFVNGAWIEEGYQSAGVF